MTRPTARTPYLVAIVSVGLALAARLALDSIFDDRHPFVFFALAVIFVSWAYGLGPGLLALWLGLIVGDFFFLEPRYTFVAAGSVEMVGGLAYLVTGTAIVISAHSTRRAERRAREREHATRAAEAERAAVMRNMGEGLYTVDTQGVVTFVNAAAERVLGWSSAELLGRKMHDATHFRYPDGTPFPAEECAGLRVLRDGTPLVDHEDTFIRKDGSFVPVVYGASRIEIEGHVVGLVVVFRDVTHQQHLLALAEDARLTAESHANAERMAR
jgi:PAS domain S-box-containing protein